MLPLQFVNGQSALSLGLVGLETFSITGIASGITPGKTLQVEAKSPQGIVRFDVKCRVDTPVEVDYVLHGGILQYVLRQMAKG